MATYTVSGSTLVCTGTDITSAGILSALNSNGLGSGHFGQTSGNKDNYFFNAQIQIGSSSSSGASSVWNCSNEIIKINANIFHVYGTVQMGSYPSNISTGGGSFIVTGTIGNDRFRLYNNGIFRAYGSFVYAQNRIRIDNDTEFTVIDCDAELEDGVSVGEGGSAFGARQQITYDRTRVHHTGAVGIKLYSYNSGANAASYSLNGTRVEKCTYGFQLGNSNNLSPILKDVQIDTCTHHIVPNLGNANVTFVNPDFTVLRGAAINSNDITTIAFRYNFKVQDASNVAIQNAKVYIVDKNSDVVVNAESTDANGLINSYLYNYDGDVCLRNSTFAGNTKTNREDHARSVYKYGFLNKTDTVTIDQDTKDFVSLLPDTNVTESNKATVDAYTEIDTAVKFYDRAASHLEDNIGTYLDFIVTRSGNQIDAGSYNVTIDATAASAFDITGNTITIKASTFTGNINTTGSFTLSNGATLNGVLNGVLNVSDGDILTEDIDGTFIVDTDSLTSFTIDGFIPTQIQTTGTGSTTIIGVNNAKLTTTTISGTGTLVLGDGLNPSSNWSVGSGTLTLNGTEGDLSGLRGLADVDYADAGGKTVYTVNDTTRIIIPGTGDLTIDSDVEQLVCGVTPANGVHTIDVKNSGRLQVGKAKNVGGFTIYSSGPAIVFTNDSANNLFTVADSWANLFIDNGGTMDWYGGEIQTIGCFNAEPSSIFNTYSNEAIFVSVSSSLQATRPEAYVRMKSSNINVNGFVNKFGIYLSIGQPTTFKGYEPISSGSAIDMSNQSASNVFYDFEDLIAGKGNTRDIGGKSETWLRLLNTNLGSDITVTAQQTNAVSDQQYIVENKKGIIFNYEDEVGNIIQGAKIYLSDTDHGNRLVANQVGTNASYLNDNVYTGSSNASGNIDFSSVANSILLSVYHHNNENGNPIYSLYDSRGNNNDVSDLFTFYSISYLQTPANVTLELKGIGTLNQSQVLVTDLLITETTKSIVDSYIELETPQKFYDRAKSYLYDNFQGEATTIVNREGNLIDCGSYDLVVDATASSVFDLTSNTITIKASTFVGELITTGTITFVNGATIDGAYTDTNGTVRLVNVSTTVSDTSTNPIENANCLVYQQTPEAITSITRSGSVATVTKSSHNLNVGDYFIVRGANEIEYNRLHQVTNVIDANSFEYNVSGTPTTPATGTITLQIVYLNGLTNASGYISNVVNYISDQPVVAIIRKSLYKNASLNATLTTIGAEIQASLISDQ